jgi:hypothetical protein
MKTTSAKKRKSSAVTEKRSSAARPRLEFAPISEEMKQWSAMLTTELSSWPHISTRSMFGFLFFYRKDAVFAALPRTRGFGTPSSLVFKFNPTPPGLLKRAKSDPRMQAHIKLSGKGWFSFEMQAESDLRDALFWLNQSYECAH